MRTQNYGPRKTWGGRVTERRGIVKNLFSSLFERTGFLFAHRKPTSHWWWLCKTRWP